MGIILNTLLLLKDTVRKYELKFQNKKNSKVKFKCPKIFNAFLFLFSNKSLVFRDGIHKLLVPIANREDPDKTASSEAV